MKIKEYTPNWVTSSEPDEIWEINSKEDLLNLFPENENGRPVLGSDHILVIVSNGMYLPVASIENKNDWNQIHEWIPTLEEYFKKF